MTKPEPIIPEPTDSAPAGDGAPNGCAAPEPHASADDAEFMSRKVRRLGRNIRLALMLNLVLGLLVTFALSRSAVPAPLLYGWLGLLALVTALRALLVHRAAAAPDDSDPRLWLRLHLVFAAAAGLLWGCAGGFLFFEPSAAQTAAILLATACITAAAAANGVHPPVVVAIVVPAILPVAAYYFSGFGDVHKAIGVTILFYGAVLLKFAASVAASARRTTALSRRNRELVESLRRTVQEVEAREAKFRIIADHSYAWECWFDGQGRLIWTSPSAERVTGYTAEELLADPRLVGAIIHPEDRNKVATAMARAREVVSSGDFEFRIVHKDGTVRWLAAVSNPVYDEEDRLAGFRSSLRDISLQRKLEAELQKLATTDGLTGALNRRAFLEKAQEEFYRSTRYDKPMTVAMIDLDHFKSVNDTHGHHAGDGCLRALAELVRSHVRKSDLFARFGGEEFILMLPETRLDDALGLCERLRRAIEATPVECEGRRIAFTASIGVADFQMNRGDIEELIARADAALYAAKRNGRNQVNYESSLPDQARGRPCRPAGIEQLHREIEPELEPAERLRAPLRRG